MAAASMIASCLLCMRRRQSHQSLRAFEMTLFAARECNAEASKPELERNQRRGLRQVGELMVEETPSPRLAEQGRRGRVSAGIQQSWGQKIYSTWGSWFAHSALSVRMSVPPHASSLPRSRLSYYPLLLLLLYFLLRYTRHTYQFNRCYEADVFVRSGEVKIWSDTRLKRKRVTDDKAGTASYIYGARILLQFLHQARQLGTQCVFA